MAALLIGWAVLIGGCELAGGDSVHQPKLMSVEVEEVPEPDPMAPMVEQMEVKATRHNRSPQTLYSVTLQGTLAQPEGLANAYGPTGWAVLEALDAQGKPMQFTSDRSALPDALQSETIAELYQRIGVSMGRRTSQRMPFSIQMREMDYLTPSLKRLKLRSFALVADGEQQMEMPLPAKDTTADLGDAWTVSVQTTASDAQELVMQAIAADPPFWPLEVELLDEQGELLSVGFRRGVETLGSTIATRWKFNQPMLISDSPRALRVRVAQGLRVKQLDAELGDVKLVELRASPGKQ